MRIWYLSHIWDAIGRDNPKKVSEYDQEIPQSQTADIAMALRGRATQQSRDTRKTKQPAFFMNPEYAIISFPPTGYQPAMMIIGSQAF